MMEDPGFICEPCGKRNHNECAGSTWCDCQHKEPKS